MKKNNLKSISIFVIACLLVISSVVLAKNDNKGKENISMAKVTELLTEGAGNFGKIPPGLLKAPGIQEKINNIDFTAPIITDINTTSTSASSSVVSWITDEDSTSMVYYGTSTNVYGNSAFGVTIATSSGFIHEVYLSDLSAGTTYYYYVKSLDQSGNVATSSEYVFILVDQNSLDYDPLPLLGWENIKVSDISAAGVHPDIAPSNEGYGIAWMSDFGEIYLTVLDRDGSKIASDILVASAADGYKGCLRPRIVWNGENFGIFWSSRDPNYPDDFYYTNDRPLFFASFDVDGNRLLENTRVTEKGASNVNIEDYIDGVWDGTGYVLVWAGNYGNQSGVYFAKINENGSRIIDKKNVMEGRWFPAKITWSDQGYGIVWWGSTNNDSPRDVYFSQLDLNGNMMGDYLNISNCAEWCGYPSIAWDGEAYGVTWVDMEIGNLYYSRINTSGQIEVESLEITDRDKRSVRIESPLVWSGSEYGVVWEDGNTLAFTKIDRDGNKLVEIKGIVDFSASHANSPRISFGNGMYGIVWNDSREGSQNIFFASGN